MKKKKENEIRVYDLHDTTSNIDREKRMTLASLGVELPADTPTKVLSLSLPTTLLNKIKAYAGQHDVSYSAMINILFAESIESKFRNVSHVGK